ncbi:MAG: hypothetical protein ACOXZH_07300 [Bacteroidales bacterium]|jgi:hypothetical protein
MKKSLLLLLISGFLLSFAACDKDNGEKVQLDPALYGKWSIGNPNEDDYLFYHFKSDATLIQHIYGSDYNWLWCIEDGKLKMYVSGGIPHYKSYKIEGNLLYFWVDSMEEWALPLTKE